MIELFGWWTLLGYIFIIATPVPKNVKAAWIVVILGGPFAWAYTLIEFINREPWKKST